MLPLANWPASERRGIVGVFTDIDDTLTTGGAITADALQALLGPGVQLLDTADAVARRVASLLDLPTPADLRGTPPSATPPPLQLLATAHPAALQQAALRWLGHGGAVQLLQLPGDAGTSRA